jgi:hypothetical protein
MLRSLGIEEIAPSIGSLSDDVFRLHNHIVNWEWGGVSKKAIAAFFNVVSVVLGVTGKNLNVAGNSSRI